MMPTMRDSPAFRPTFNSAAKFCRVKISEKEKGNGKEDGLDVQRAQSDARAGDSRAQRHLDNVSGGSLMWGAIVEPTLVP
jgi:hypothetical protein